VVRQMMLNDSFIGQFYTSYNGEEEEKEIE
jgi:hypothetical protein